MEVGRVRLSRVIVQGGCGPHSRVIALTGEYGQIKSHISSDVGGEGLRRNGR